MSNVQPNSLFKIVATDLQTQPTGWSRKSSW